MLLIVQPIAVILPSIDPLVHTFTFHFVADKVAFESTPIRPNKSASSVLLPITIVSLENGAIGPDLLAKAMMLVL